VFPKSLKRLDILKIKNQIILERVLSKVILKIESKRDSYKVISPNSIEKVSIETVGWIFIFIKKNEWQQFELLLLR